MVKQFHKPCPWLQCILLNRRLKRRMRRSESTSLVLHTRCMTARTLPRTMSITWPDVNGKMFKPWHEGGSVPVHCTGNYRQQHVRLPARPRNSNAKPRKRRTSNTQLKEENIALINGEHCIASIGRNLRTLWQNNASIQSEGYVLTLTN